MTRKAYDSDGDDAALAFATPPQSLPPVTLSDFEAGRLLDALRDADEALRLAEGSKMYGIRSAAMRARKRVVIEWGHLAGRRGASVKAQQQEVGEP